MDNPLKNISVRKENVVSVILIAIFIVFQSLSALFAYRADKSAERAAKAYESAKTEIITTIKEVSKNDSIRLEKLTKFNELNLNRTIRKQDNRQTIDDLKKELGL